MRYLTLATDYDGTLAHDGRVSDSTVAALERLRKSGRRLVMVTGRELEDLQKTFPRLDLFDQVVAENGALLYKPGAKEEKVLAGGPAAGLPGGAAEAGRAAFPWAGSSWPPGNRTRRPCSTPSTSSAWSCTSSSTRGRSWCCRRGVNKATRPGRRAGRVEAVAAQRRRRRRRRERPRLPDRLRVRRGRGQRPAGREGPRRLRHPRRPRRRRGRADRPAHRRRPGRGRGAAAATRHPDRQAAGRRGGAHRRLTAPTCWWRGRPAAANRR